MKKTSIIFLLLLKAMFTYSCMAASDLGEEIKQSNTIRSLTTAQKNLIDKGVILASELFWPHDDGEPYSALSMLNRRICLAGNGDKVVYFDEPKKKFHIYNLNEQELNLLLSIDFPTYSKEKGIVSLKRLSERFLIFAIGLSPDKEFIENIGALEESQEDLYKTYKIEQNYFIDLFENKIYEITHPNYSKALFYKKASLNENKVVVRLLSPINEPESQKNLFIEYNLETRLFDAIPHFISNSHYTTLYYQYNKTGVNCPRYGVEGRFVDDKHIFQIIENNNGETLYKASHLSMGWKRENVIECIKNDKLIYRQRMGKEEFYVPFKKDLNDKDLSNFTCLLSEEQIDSLKSHVYDVIYIDGLFFYKTNYLKPLFHFAGGSPESDDARILLKLFSEHYENQDNGWNIIDWIKGQNIFLVHNQEPNKFNQFALINTEQEDFRIKKFTIPVSEKSLIKRVQPLYTDAIISTHTGMHITVIYSMPSEINRNKTFIIYAHGGPQSKECYGWDALKLMHFFTSRGYVYIKINPRGSIGLGKSIQEGCRPWLNVLDDYEDVANWAKSKGYGDKYIVIGPSFGGYIAAGMLTRGAKAAVSINGIFDLELNFEETKAYEEKLLENECHLNRGNNEELLDQLLSFFKKYHGETPEERIKNSITSYIASMKGQLLLVTGLEDTISFTQQSRLLFNKYNQSTLVTLENQGHDPTLDDSSYYKLIRGIEEFVAQNSEGIFEIGGMQEMEKTQGVKVYHQSIVPRKF